jgi:polyhydroxyalkanoate synthesis repressor PhaR
MYSLIRTRATKRVRRTILDTKPETAPSPPESTSPERPVRVIKRYSNRKLYDTKDSRYVTLLQIAEMVRTGEEVLIIDNNTKDDLTEVTLAQIIYEEQKAHSRSVPLQTLKELIHARTEKVLEGLREGPIGRLIPGAKPTDEKGVETATPASVVPAAKEVKPTLVDQAKEKFEEVQHQLDERIKAILATFRPFQQMQQELRRLNERVEDLERKLKGGQH